MYPTPKKIRVDFEYEDHYLDSDGKLHSTTKTGHKTITVNVNIHDEAFNDSVDDSVGKIEGLTDAIVGFKTANIAVKKANEQAIVGHATSGFMNMIEQNINLQNAGMEADMHALAGELTQQCKELTHKHEVMAKDFSRIKSRYTDLFETINKEFRNRMQALVKPCFDFVGQVKKEQSRRSDSSLLSMATIGGKESDSARISIQASKMKENAVSLINTSRNYIAENRSLNRAVSLFSLDGNQAETYYAPVIVVSESCSNTADVLTKVYMNPNCNTGEQIEKLVIQQCNRLNDHQMTSDTHSRISSYFNQQLDEMNDGSAEAYRIISKMRTLFEHSTMRTFA